MNVKEEYLRVYARIDLDALRKNMEHMKENLSKYRKFKMRI